MQKSQKMNLIDMPMDYHAWAQNWNAIRDIRQS